MQRVCDHRCRIIHEAPQLGTQVGILDREAIFHVSNDFTHDLEWRVLAQEDEDADFAPYAGLH